MVHALKHGVAMCGAGLPSTWPPGTKWVSFQDVELHPKIDCAACRAALKLPDGR